MNRFLLASLLLCGCIASPHPEPIPGPGPSPQPPAPAVGKISVLIVTDSDGPQISRDQSAAIFGGEVRDYIRSHGQLESDGKTPQHRILSPRADVSHETGFWQEGFERIKDRTPPYIAITTGAAGTEGPCPANTQEMLTVLRKWGGP